MTSLLNPPLPGAAARKLEWRQLYGSAAALALAEGLLADTRLYVVIADAARALERLSAELRFFAGHGLPLLRLPDWEVLPYDLFSPHPDIISERLQTLYELPYVKRGCLIVSADTLMQRLPPRDYVQGRAFELSAGQSLALEPFRQRLVEAGYASVSQVASPGEFAVRGSLLDVFPMGSTAPLRIDLFDDEIDGHPPLRSGDAALAGCARGGAAAAGARGAARCAGGARLPPPLPDALRGRPDAGAPCTAA